MRVIIAENVESVSAIAFKYDLTPYLTDWTTEEVTIRINIDATQGTIDLEGFEMGDTSDFIFDMDDYLTCK